MKTLSRIWMVNRDAETSTRFSEVLTSDGYIVEVMPEKPVEPAPEQRPKVIVLGVIESGMPGLNVLIAARKLNPPIPVVVLVGQNQIRIVVEALKLGASDAGATPTGNSSIVSTFRSIAYATAFMFSRITSTQTIFFPNRSTRITLQPSRSASRQVKENVRGRSPY